MPVTWWALLGAASVLLIGVILIQWVGQGIHAVAPGSDAFPLRRQIALRIVEWLQFAVFLVLMSRFVVGPLRRREPLRFDGLFLLAALLLNFWGAVSRGGSSTCTPIRRARISTSCARRSTSTDWS
jgi:hypothetical protein